MQERRTCLAAFPGDAKNAQHGSDMIDEREAAGLTLEFVFASFCGDGVSCCCSGVISSSQSRGPMERSVVSMRRLGRGRFLLPPRRGGSVCDAEKTNDGAPRPTEGSVVFLAAAEDGEPSFAHAVPFGGKNSNPTPRVVDPVRAVFAEWRDAAAPLPVSIKDASQPLAVEHMGVKGCFGEGKNVSLPVLEPLEVGVSGPSGEAANTKPPLEVGPVGVLGRSGAAKNANMFPAQLASDPPAEVGWRGRSPGSNENAARGTIGEMGGGGGVGGVDGVFGVVSKGGSSRSILLRTEEAGRRQRRLRLASAAQGAEKATA